MNAARTGWVVGGVRLTWAAVLLARPQRIIELLGGDNTAESRLILRVLGVRHLLQGVAEVTLWPKGRRVGSVIDAAHSMSAAGFALADPHWRRPATIDAAIAGTFALAGAARPPTGRHG